MKKTAPPLWPGAERRYPIFSNPCRFTLIRIREEIEKIAARLPSNSDILDFGCGDKPYYPILKDKTKRYIGIDIRDTPEKGENIDIIISGSQKIPFKNDNFDLIISTEVFEHIENLSYYANELYRVLKPNGELFIAAPFVWDYHPYPKDYWRISEDGYRKLFPGARKIIFDQDTNSIQTIFQALNLILARRGWPNIFIIALNFLIKSINYKKGDKNLPSNIFVYVKKSTSRREVYKK